MQLHLLDYPILLSYSYQFTYASSALNRRSDLDYYLALTQIVIQVNINPACYIAKWYIQNSKYM